MVVEAEVREGLNGVDNIVRMRIMLEVVGILCLGLNKQVRERAQVWASGTQLLCLVVPGGRDVCRVADTCCIFCVRYVYYIRFVETNRLKKYVCIPGGR